MQVAYTATIQHNAATWHDTWHVTTIRQKMTTTVFGFGPKWQLRQRCLASAPNGSYSDDVWLQPQMAVTVAMFGFGPKWQLWQRETMVRQQCLALAPNGSYDGKRWRYDDNVWLWPQTAVTMAWRWRFWLRPQMAITTEQREWQGGQGGRQRYNSNVTTAARRHTRRWRVSHLC